MFCLVTCDVVIFFPYLIDKKCLGWRNNVPMQKAESYFLILGKTISCVFGQFAKRLLLRTVLAITQNGGRKVDLLPWESI